MESNIAIGTHHKTGTYLMESVFSEYARIHNLDLINIRESTKYQIANGNPIIWFDYAFDPTIFTCRCVHTIRDPRDIIVSATKYHMIAKEDWLDEYYPAFGMSYREKLTSYSSFEDQLLFEMNNQSQRNIFRMVTALKRSKENVLHVNLYDLIFVKELETTWYKIQQFLFLNDNFLDCVYKVLGSKSNHQQHNSPNIHLEYFTDKCYSEFDRLYPKIWNTIYAKY